MNENVGKTDKIKNNVARKADKNNGKYIVKTDKTWHTIKKMIQEWR